MGCFVTPINGLNGRRSIREFYVLFLLLVLFRFSVAHGGLRLVWVFLLGAMARIFNGPIKG